MPIEWLKLAVRWIHVFAVILWIGQTYLFNFFEDNLEADPSRPNVAGNLWLVHGGGFYLVEKQRLPEMRPQILHWFKWEAATTWLSGAVLIALTYYGGGLLVEPEQDYTVAAALGIGVILGGWFVYDGLMRSPLGRRPWLFAVVGWVLLVGLTLLLCRYQSERSAYIHVGAMLGTIMAANVWLRILPSQRCMIAMTKAGRVPDFNLLATGPLRSRHNSYLVVPLVALMISNHYPTISYGHRYNWLVLGVLLLLGWAAARMFRRS